VDYFVVDVKKISSAPSGVGSRYHQVRKTDEQLIRVTAFVPGRLIEARTEPGSSPQLEMRLTFEPEGSMTLLRDQWKLEMGKPAILERLATGRVKSAVAENLSKLKELLEQGSVVPQDGREARLDGFSAPASVKGGR